jgi:hypothetical protein
MILQGAAEKPDGFKTKLYNDILPYNLAVVITEELSSAILCFDKCSTNVGHHFSHTVLIFMEDIPLSVESPPARLLRFFLYSLL